MKNVLKVTELWHEESSRCDFSEVDIQRWSHFSECQDNLFLQITTCTVSVCKGGMSMTKQKPQWTHRESIRKNTTALESLKSAFQWLSLANFQKALSHSYAVIDFTNH